VGQGNALYLIETGVTIGAERAREMGLVQETVPEGRALERALELADRIAAYPQPTLEADRNSALDAFSMDLETGLRREVDVGLQAGGDPAMAEGLERWKAGERPPAPEGR
jgi:enoyl-CoA hydratase